MRNRIAVVAWVVALVFGSAVTSAALIDNVDYTSWSKQKPGAKVVHEMTMAMQGMTITTEVTQVLKSVAPDKAVLDVTTVINMGGLKQEQKATKDVPAKVEETQQQLPGEMKGTMKKTGTGSIKAANQEFQCEIHEFTGTAPTGSANGKMWRSEKVPGGVVQTELIMQTPQGNANATMVLKSMTP